MKREGIFGPWVGFWAFWMYAAPHTMISLVTLDYLNLHFGSSVMQR